MLRQSMVESSWMVHEEIFGGKPLGKPMNPADLKDCRQTASDSTRLS